MVVERDGGTNRLRLACGLSWADDGELIAEPP